MFEKDVLQLIRGLRANKGQEREYIQAALRECRKEIKSQDMDVKAVALLKLVYLEMFGHDMSWASFNVLEVMSSQKFLPKRVGYLAAAQSFRPDTEVLMLAENLLKKDLGSTDKNTISLTLATVPHLVNPGMANSLLTDLLPRMSHSDPRIRKKTIVALYRLAVVYPEILRPAWPKIKERLLDENEDPSVTAAIVNVVCELGWRRPQEFLSLAPRLFELLTTGNNNWMAIKIIKLFSALTPIEPRLVKKLLPPLTELIKTTPAMSLLYECINGIIQGGIMQAAEGTREGDEIARLCTQKLRGMLVVQNDPNLRYVALLAFTKITTSHPSFVAEHQDVLLECIDDPDISIRTRALDLVMGMISTTNLQPIVNRLLKQLQSAGRVSPANGVSNDRGQQDPIEGLGEDDDEEAEQSLYQSQQQTTLSPPLPDHFRQLVIERILEMCAKDMYANLLDFEWYTGILVKLIKECPTYTPSSKAATAVGEELLNLAIRVKELRPEVVAEAQSLLLGESLGVAHARAWPGVAGSVAFIAGEYAPLLRDPAAVVTALSNPDNSALPDNVLAVYLQALLKTFSEMASHERYWKSSAGRSEIALLMARIIHFLEPLTLRPALEVQERAVEFLEFCRLAAHAIKPESACSAQEQGQVDVPLLFSQALPSLFTGMELNPIAASAIFRVPVPDNLDLENPINPSLPILLQRADVNSGGDSANNDDVSKYYHERPPKVQSISNSQRPAAERLSSAIAQSTASYQDEETDSNVLEQRRAERQERYKDDPYYIGSERNSGTSTPLGNAIRSATNGEELNIEAIPVMKLNLNGQGLAELPTTVTEPRKKKPMRQFQIAGDETLDSSDNTTRPTPSPSTSLNRPGTKTSKRGLLDVDSSGLSTLHLEGNRGFSTLDVERQAQEDEEMARAMKEVERLRLAMQRRSEGITEVAGGEGITVKRTKKKIRTGVIESGGEHARQEGESASNERTKKTKKMSKTDSTKDVDATRVPPKRKKKRVIAFEEPPG